VQVQNVATQLISFFIYIVHTECGQQHNLLC